MIRILTSLIVRARAPWQHIKRGTDNIDSGVALLCWQPVDCHIQFDLARQLRPIVVDRRS